MLVSIQIALVVASTGIFLLLLFFLIKRCCCYPNQQQPIGKAPSFRNSISELHHQDNNFNNKRRTNYYVFRRGVSSKPLFNWSDNPSLITDAVENGWSRFAFTKYASSSDCGGDAVEIGWEVCRGSAELMQKIRLNSGLSKVITTTTSSMAAASVIKSALPLPGPALVNSSPFPQEAYFEITILSNIGEEYGSDVNREVRIKKGEGEKSRGVHVNIEELRGKSETKDVVEGTSEVAIMLSVGLAGGGSLPSKLPGSYPGSVGFNSDGSVHLDGVKLVNESETESKRWERSEVIGCGYNPSQKKVFFTIGCQLIHEIQCKSEEYGTPLYPILAANGNVTILVNFGQSVFKYAPANLQRTPNPCFTGPLTKSPALGYEDSKELFSMGRIDSQWFYRSTKSTQNNASVNRGIIDYDEASEGELFEIVLDGNSCRKSPNTLF